jgi:membrane-associated phospholipid phosphatase
VFRTVLLLTLATAAAAPGQSIPVQPPAADVVLAWNDMARGAIRTEKTPPPVAARNLAVVHVAVHDAVTDSPAGTSAEAAAAAAAHRALSEIYPRHAASFDDYLAETLAGVAAGAGRDAGLAFGRRAADQVLVWRANDLAPRYSAYTPRPGPGRWEPTLPGYHPPLLPGWAGVSYFFLIDAAAIRPPGPPQLDSAAYAAGFREVRALGGRHSPTRSREQTEIADFWADGEGTVTPPGHWNRIARTVSAARKLSLAENARLFAALNAALADAAIACWECKYRFNVWRPVTAIRAGGPGLTPDPDWEPLLDTPPFPAYTSGHSTFSGAAAAVLAAAFGTDAVRFDTTSDGLPGVARSFPGFAAAAREAGLSRIYGGIHWDFDNRDGLASGRRVGEHVARHFYPQSARRPDRPAPAVFSVRDR